MIKRHDINEIRKLFEIEGYTLLTDVYKNSRTKLEYICPNGHKSHTNFSNWYFHNKRCKYCAKNAPVAYETVKETFEKEGYTLLSKEYIKSSIKLEYICPKGTHGSIPWNNFQQGNRCPCCYGKNNKLTIEKVRRSFEEKGYILLDDVYVNAQTKLNYICPNGHKNSIAWNSWDQGHRCPDCFGNTKLTIDYIRAEFYKDNYTLLEEEYKGNKVKMEYLCSNGHKHSTTWNNWRTGYRCPICDDLKKSGSGNPSWKGGISYEPYCPIWKDKEYKNDLKERDGNKCLNPTCEIKTGYSGKLVIHHIDYNKKNCHPNNLITVCNSCNSKANTDRDWHQSWYKAMMLKRNRGMVV